MQLDRNIEGNEGRGKYALLLLRKLATYNDGETFGGLPPRIADALKVLEDEGLIDWGIVGTPSEFFVIRLKDVYAGAALAAYAMESRPFDPEWSREVEELSDRAGRCSPYRKLPD